MCQTHAVRSPLDAMEYPASTAQRGGDVADRGRGGSRPGCGRRREEVLHAGAGPVRARVVPAPPGVGAAAAEDAVLAAARAIVTVEEVVDDLGTTGTNAVVLPSWTVHAVAVAPGGARPSYAHGYYHRDNAFYTEWDAIARDRDR